MDQRFDPLGEIAKLRNTLTRAINQGMRAPNQPYPPVDVYVTDSAVIVRTAPIPWLNKSSVEVSMENDTLHVRGETLPDTEIPEAAYVLREVFTGRFERTITLPVEVHADKAQAAFKEGVLTITLPVVKDAAGSSRIIAVTPIER